MASEDGGNAFPAMYPNAHNTGMSLRDYFAAKAMQGIQSLQDNRVWKSDSGKPYDDWLKECFADDAKKARMAADALLAELRKEAADGNRD